MPFFKLLISGKIGYHIRTDFNSGQPVLSGIVTAGCAKANRFCLLVYVMCSFLMIFPFGRKRVFRIVRMEDPMHNTHKMIELKNIFKWYQVGGSRSFVLKDIHLTINKGEFISIMGPSGSGKSTLLHILGLLDEPDEGSYLFQGEDVLRLREKQRTVLYKKFIGFVFQAYHLIDELTVYENIETPLIYQHIGSSERKAIVADLLDRFGIVGKKDLFPAQLSGGQQQMVGIARALGAKPTLLLADEPTGNLNSKQGEEIMELFRQLNREDGVTIVQVTHSEKNAAYGNRIIDLLDGQISE